MTLSGSTDLLRISCQLFFHAAMFMEHSHMLVDDAGQTPFHLAMQQPLNDTSIMVCRILGNYHIDPDVVDLQGQKASEYVTDQNDSRLPFLFGTQLTQASISSCRILEKEFFDRHFPALVRSKLPISLDHEEHDAEETVQCVRPSFLSKLKVLGEWECVFNVRALDFFANPETSLQQKLATWKHIQLIMQGIEPEERRVLVPSKQVYAAPVSGYKDTHLLYQSAVEFSACYSRRHNLPLYGDTIRVWAILRSESELDKVRNAVANGEKQASRELEEVPLVTESQLPSDGPKLFKRCDHDPSVFVHPHVKDESGVVPFFEITAHTLHSIISKCTIDIQTLPMKLSEKEYEIVRMKYHEKAIMVIGRSGTGKTTSCIMRMLEEYQNETNFVYVPLLEPGKDHYLLPSASSVPPLLLPSEDDILCASNVFKQNIPVGGRKINQIFVTKSPTLLAQVQNKFNKLSDLQPSVNKVPLRLSENTQFPLFLTSRDLLISLDGCLTNGEGCFFDRNKDGSLAVQVVNSEFNYELAMLFDDNVTFDLGTLEVAHKPSVQNLHEVTPLCFKQQIWPEIVKGSNAAKFRDLYDPILVWQEIRSFIKGSADALLSEKGYLEKEDYINLGKKKAYNFMEKEREDIYHIFEQYHTHTKKSRFTKNYFDECDIVHSIYKRLKLVKTQDLPFTIHTAYVDEVQDFIEAELYILLCICQCPNGHFFSGDTAQSIVQGVSFRFSDLCSLYTKLNTSEIFPSKSSIMQPKDPIWLTTNYRTHAGINNLANSMLAFLEDLCPDSFDRHSFQDIASPKPLLPIIIESSKERDLLDLLCEAFGLLSAHKVDFGAQQAVIVPTEDVKQSLPESLKDALVLTVFEAKGLEFHDVLLYNFLNNSEVRI